MICYIIIAVYDIWLLSADPGRRKGERAREKDIFRRPFGSLQQQQQQQQQQQAAAGSSRQQ